MLFHTFLNIFLFSSRNSSQARRVAAWSVWFGQFFFSGSIPHITYRLMSSYRECTVHSGTYRDRDYRVTILYSQIHQENFCFVILVVKVRRNLFLINYFHAFFSAAVIWILVFILSSHVMFHVYIYLFIYVTTNGVSYEVSQSFIRRIMSIKLTT